MSEARDTLLGMAEGLFDDLAGLDFAAGWPRLAEAGFDTLLVPEADGGFGGDWGDLAALLKLAGSKALALPLAEPVLARMVLAKAGVAAPEGLVTLAVAGERAPWGRHAAAVIEHDGAGTARLWPASACSFDEGQSPASEPRDAVTFGGQPLAAFACDLDLAALLAFARVAAGAGALEDSIALTIAHDTTRVQFGKPLAQFQAVQQALAIAAEEGAALAFAAEGAAMALDRWAAGQGAFPAFEIAAAKVRLGLAVERAVPIVHRLHGAIGFTIEYPLNHRTRRLMGWRSEYGNDAHWQGELGRMVAAGGSARFWPDLVERTDPVPATA